MEVTLDETNEMTKIDILLAIEYLESTPAKLSKKQTREANITNNIIDVLQWVLLFIDFYNTSFKTKDGQYKKSGWARAIGIASGLFKLGLKLINLKK